MKIPMEDWLRGCVYHDGRHGEVTLSTDKVLEIADYIQPTRTSLADGMIELPPYEPKDEPQTCSVSGRPYSECSDCEYFRCTADEPQNGYVLSKDSDAYKFNKRMEVEEGWLKEQSGKE